MLRAAATGAVSRNAGKNIISRRRKETPPDDFGAALLQSTDDGLPAEAHEVREAEHRVQLCLQPCLGRRVCHHERQSFEKAANLFEYEYNMEMRLLHLLRSALCCCSVTMLHSASRRLADVVIFKISAAAGAERRTTGVARAPLSAGRQLLLSECEFPQRHVPHHLHTANITLTTMLTGSSLTTSACGQGGRLPCRILGVEWLQCLQGGSGKD